uniref:Major facilitator superfamily (MFS) profile domain-containing protein n=1 Tax=Megaselia scalaris TaxID=36166 RepID=T1H5K0_MEGSC
INKFSNILQKNIFLLYNLLSSRLLFDNFTLQKFHNSFRMNFSILLNIEFNNILLLGLFGRSGFRYVQTFLLFFGITAALFVRANVGIAVVAITDIKTEDHSYYSWTFDEKQLILSTFYWGYIFTQVPGGYAAQKLGSKIVLLLSILLSSLLSLVTPVSIIYGGWRAYCVIRVLQGLAQGVMLPSIYDHLAKWSPKEERNLQGTLALSGYSCGLVFGMGISGVIAASAMKWPGIFYVSGAIGVFWSILWIIFGASTPNSSRFITEKEKKFIESTQREDNNTTAKPNNQYHGGKSSHHHHFWLCCLYPAANHSEHSSPALKCPFISMQF